MLHRNAELEVIDRVITRLAEGQPSVLAIQGSRGIGKSTLLSAALEKVSDHATVLQARCHPSERPFEFAVVRQLFDPIMNAQPDALGAPRDGGLYELYRTARSLASNRPLVIAIDDVTCADAPSAQWCAYIARRLDRLPAAMIVTCDTGDPLVNDLATLPYHYLLRPETLCERCCAHLLEAVLGVQPGPAFAARCHALSGGNPYLLRELASRLRAAGVEPDEAGLHAAAELGAATLAETSLAWLRRRSPESVALAECLAILAPDAGLSIAAAIAGQGETVASVAALALREAGLLDGERFVNDRVRAAIRTGMDAGRRDDLHTRAAGLLHRLGAPPGVCAEHVMSAAPAGDPRAVDILREAAAEETRQAAWPTAARYLRRALAQSAEPQPEVVTALGAVELHLDLPAARRHLSSVCSPQELLPFASPLLTLNAPEAGPLFAAAAGRSDDRAARLAFGAQALLAGLGTTPSILRLLGGDPPARSYLSALALATAATGRRQARTVELATRALNTISTLSGAVPSALVAALALAWAERSDEACYWAERALAEARGSASPAEHAFALLVVSEIAYRRGRLDQALATAKEAIARASEVRGGAFYVAAVSQVGRVLLELGEPDAAQAQLVEVESYSTDSPLIWASHLEVRGRIHLARNECREALRLFRESGRHLHARGIANPSCLPWRGQAVLAHVKLGEAQKARRLADEDVRLARRWGTPGALGRALSVAGVAREDEARLGLLREAADLLERSSARLDEARARIRLGVALRQCGEKALALPALQQGMNVADECGAVRLARLAHEHLVAMGAHLPARRAAPGSAPTSPAQGLTVAEQRVVQLVLQEMSNLEVANTLSISKRTVDTHLARIYRKLGIHTRADLARALRHHDGIG
ncbi:AAA family ATPase [Nonomuraea sp. LPB2021202275-12-8]|uniref:AAA family ATPase n=1 Tax=Nonomuraea sp. LPB2021202275-12-8 TaxID=3120159 RepID=UPI00300C0749